MRAWILRRLGVKEDRPGPAPVRFQATPAEFHYECVRRETERKIAHTDRETERGRARFVTWQDLYDPGSQR